MRSSCGPLTPLTPAKLMFFRTITKLSDEKISFKANLFVEWIEKGLYS